MTSHQLLNSSHFAERDELAEFRWQENRVHQIADVLRALPNKRTAADLGCMSGMATAFYAKTGFAQFHGFDIAPISIKRLNTKGFEGYVWNMDGDPCPQSDAYYDVVVAGEVVEHIVQTDYFLDEVLRILKPGGYFIVTTPNLASWYNRVRLLRGKPPRSFPGVSPGFRSDSLIDTNHIRMNVATEWLPFFASRGFVCEQIKGIAHFLALNPGWKIHWLEKVDQWFCRFPMLASGLLFVCRKPL